ncbi:glucokinase [Chitinophaga sp. CF418]|uniref:glucokinase n=1 Tax=Chitinophaga sp. CF418 TaxID=1855287 RepID=UPI000924377E|nr:glucokinase [Chitinophaga sp. CF418]SHN36192.1 glucokinase [Chitinophaga sp. CF418]
MLIPIAFPRLTPPPGQCTILAGDVGGTKTDLAIFRRDDATLTSVKQAQFKTREFPGLIQMIAYFLEGENMPDVISLGVAGPVQDGKVCITNIPMAVDSFDISKHFSHVPVLLVNDLEATAYGLFALTPRDTFVIHEGKKAIRGNVAVIAPGTGLGEAGLYSDGNASHPFATEGGHCDFAPRNELDTDLYMYLHKKFGHVSWERVVSGPGICNIYDFLVNEKQRKPSLLITEKMQGHDRAAMITKNTDTCPVCKETIELFMRYLAEESANLVLKFKATGGVFIAGGILPQILQLVQKDIFMTCFCDSGRLKTLLQDVPVKIILNREAALLGAAWYGFYSR